MNETTLDQVLTQRREANKDIVNVDEPAVKLVVFDLGDQRFAFYSDRIREILAQADVFFVPGSPPSLEGVINVRGDIESVIRPHDMLHLSDSNIGRASSILLGRGSGNCRKRSARQPPSLSRGGGVPVLVLSGPWALLWGDPLPGRRVLCRASEAEDWCRES